jgi:excinuclease ABC subunit A
VGTAFREGDGEVLALIPEGEVPEGPETLAFTERFRCPEHPEIEFPAPSPQLFSFNSPIGSCPECTGFGATLEYDENLIVPNPRKSLDEGAIDPWTKPRYKKERARLRAYADRLGVSNHLPWDELPEEFRKTILHGNTSRRGKLTDKGFQGVYPFLKLREKKRYKQYIRVFLRQYQSPQECSRCGGSRLREEALHVRVAGRSIARLARLPLEVFIEWL